MTSEFPLLSAVLEQSLGPLPPAHDIGRVLGALGIAGASYHSFEPPRPPEAPPAEARMPEPAAASQAIADDVAVAPVHSGMVDRPTLAVPMQAEPAAADLHQPEPRSHEPSRDAPVWTTPTLGMPTRTEPRISAQAAPAPLAHASLSNTPIPNVMAEHASADEAWSRYPAEPDRAAPRPADRTAPEGIATSAPPPIRQPLSLSGLFRILGSPTPAQATPSRSLRDVFGYSNKCNS